MDKLRPIHKYNLTEHAMYQLKRRGINKAEIDDVLSNPEQMSIIRRGRAVYQSRVDLDDDRTYLIRIFVDVNLDPPEVVTCYKTSKIEKYWR